MLEIFSFDKEKYLETNYQCKYCTYDSLAKLKEGM
jgi:hypothetical protein